MKCPTCGAEIGNNKYCEACGMRVAETSQNEQERKRSCPECGSSNIQFRRENQGEVRGKSSKQIIHRTVGFCKDCGATWYPNTSANEVPKKRKTWLWVLGWLLIFPLSLTILMLRKKEMNAILKYGIIAAAWLIYLLIGLGANSSNDMEKADAGQTNVYEIKGEELGEYGKKVILNENTDLPDTNYLYKLPAGTYEVTTDTDKMASFYIVKDEINQNSDNPDYPEELNYVSSEGYLLTAGDDDFNGHAKKSVTVELAEDESFQIVGTDTLFFEKIK